MTRKDWAVLSSGVLVAAMGLVVWLVANAASDASGVRIIAALCLTFLACRFADLTRHFRKPTP